VFLFVFVCVFVFELILFEFGEGGRWIGSTHTGEVCITEPLEW